MRLVFAEPAARYLDSILDYIALDKPTAAENVYRSIFATAERLTQFPEMGRVCRLPDTREFSVSSLPYIIVYEVGHDVVTILTVFHSSRDLASALAARSAELKP